MSLLKFFYDTGTVLETILAIADAVALVALILSAIKNKGKTGLYCILFLTLLVPLLFSLYVRNTYELQPDGTLVKKSETLLTLEPATTAPETPTALPPSEIYAASDHITFGEYRIKSAFDSKYIGVGQVKTNSSGVPGRYIAMYSDRTEAVLIEVANQSGNVCRLQTDAIDHDTFYIEAYSSKLTNYGADLWRRGRDEDQEWIVERQLDGSYVIYLSAYPELCLTYLASDDPNHSDLVSVRQRNGSIYQRWYLTTDD